MESVYRGPCKSSSQGGRLLRNVAGLLSACSSRDCPTMSDYLPRGSEYTDAAQGAGGTHGASHGDSFLGVIIFSRQTRLSPIEFQGFTENLF